MRGNCYIGYVFTVTVQGAIAKTLTPHFGYYDLEE
jgi:hypothetical protein